jgi:uncharacterized membrane protein YjgN (DUF898 family)
MLRNTTVCGIHYVSTAMSPGVFMRTAERFATGVVIGIALVAIYFVFGGWPAGGSVRDAFRKEAE